MAAKVQFKFREDASSDERDELIAKLEGNGAESVEPLFPDAPDDELAALYSALIAEDGQFSKALRMLKRSKKVEFAEPEVQRHLIVPVEQTSKNGSRRR
jgi:hypothetical protein